ncbi:VOC family protein [Vibrio ostreicida]|uniref:VOC family protein n=1 Tax=Vibrio ostreicida TaxID=526588 RepID=A0ABT8BX27_9VIBR|nr:VOC family protein [Vibrio ostreicida]MDN3610628.1 VOC family protein [Vibrio ostreicida]NPD07374.1 VOC family protein [Vibrio ostreicida]
MSQRPLDVELMPFQLKAKLNDFMDRIQGLSEKLAIDLSALQADHIALRVNDLSLAEQVHKEWLKEGREISTAIINGRPIIVIEFDQPLTAAHWTIECLELPYPAAGKIYPVQSWEHVEFVMPSLACSAEQFLEDIKRRFPSFDNQWDSLKEQGVTVKLSSPKGEGERLDNPTVAFKHEGVCIKLHPYSLKQIVASEQST